MINPTRPEISLLRSVIAKHMRSFFIIIPLCFVLLFQSSALPAETIAVRHKGGLLHGFLQLRNLEGNVIADGDLTQVAQGDRITTHLIFHFKDGSINDETTVYSQLATFRLLSDHLIQKGPSFKRAIDMSIDASTGQVKVHYADEDGKEKVIADKIVVPPDLANGIVPTLMENFSSAAPQVTLSMVAATPKPRVVKLAISPEGQESFSVGGSSYKATKYLVKIEIGGAAGLVAPLVGKAPPDMHFWVTDGPAPVLVRSEGPLYEGGPIWRIELASPAWPQETAANSTKGPVSR
jgi:hypothetical protein